MQKIFTLVLSLAIGLFSIAQKPLLNPIQVATGFTSPVDIKNCDDGRIFIVEQAGKIRIMNKQGVINATAFLDIHSSVLSSGNEQGLLSVAFPPNYKQTGFFYVNYITGTGNGSTRISRFQVSPTDSNAADPSSEKILLQFNQPFTNHKGATLMFGHDGYLYDTQGDGGSGNDPNGNGQNLNTFLGKILRFDVSNPDTTYLIPAGNPFAGDTTKKQAIWAYGVRNPWRCSVDRLTGDIWIGDVGQDNYEEVDFQAAADTGGHNYGWKCREGFHACPTCVVTGCPSAGFTEPIFEYVHSNTNGCSITGGYVYRGAQFSRLFGRYLFTDFCSGRIVSAQQTGVNQFHFDTLQTFLANQYSSFGEDNTGELYLAGRSNGRIYRLVDTSNCNPVAFISFKDSLAPICDRASISALYGDSLSYQWYNSTGAISGANNIQYQPNQSGWYKVKASRSEVGCEALSDSVYVTINHPDAITACNNCSFEFCSDRQSSLTSLFTPTGGVYSGLGVVTDSIFNGSLLTPDTGGVYPLDTLVYTYTNQTGCVSRDTFAVQTTICTGIKNLAESVSFELSPNPNKGTFTINLQTNKMQQAQLYVIDNLGKVCFEKKQMLDPSDPIIPVSLPWLSRGTYTVQIKGKNSIATKQMVIN